MARNKYIPYIIFLIVLICLIIYKICQGAINRNLISNCKNKPSNTFCGLEKINLSIPDELKTEILNEVSNGEGKRIVIPGWKAGRTISTQSVLKKIPRVFDWYKNLELQMGSFIGEMVYITPEHLPTTCSVLIYEEDNDFINWHWWYWKNKG